MKYITLQNVFALGNLSTQAMTDLQVKAMFLSIITIEITNKYSFLSLLFSL